ncbi:2-C-methyl-D-erythritol 4-phosphate cytidylyltransferase [Vallitalea pronyensis]|uniref:2-C-methyl-D-erythritol 4-phosphate cytidylyltransferase n=1 Tax=Vallitalea pronyensis TaxID=1348613 RepID=A0A8J8MNZ7_9FIRM|nr:2-C-methyl-D-erythritol 4-phosphate cytidylyltransferase [Vallitalea pronyensis]QUI24907.1 2-C-methyl-D-erythritol 4-phosphate cytidylyltransferase [Vallitalea pronyensis]
MDQLKCTVIIPAAGKGKRMKHHQHKQYIELKGKPILVYTLEAFMRCDAITHIIIVVGQGEVDYCKQEIVQPYSLDKVISVIEGGKERQDSVYEGIKCIPQETDIVLIHDAARPFIQEEHIISTIKEANKSGACVLGVKVKDTIKVVNNEGNIISTPNRDMLWAIQTPQTFKKEIIKEAYEQAIKYKFVATDDAMVVEKYADTTVTIVEGSYGNIKITTQEDLMVANALDL